MPQLSKKWLVAWLDRYAAFTSCAVLIALVAASEGMAQTQQQPRVDVYLAGTIWPGDGPAITDGILVIQDGKVVAIGPRATTEYPDGAELHHLGGQTLIPGLVIAQTGLVESTRDSDYAITPEVLAVDGFDPFADYRQWIESGVTTVQLSPGTQRLIPGQGAVVKLSGSEPSRQVLNNSESLRIVLTREALSPPTIYEPPVGAVSVERPVEPTRPQLATSLAQAIVGLDALFSAATEAELSDTSIQVLAQLISHQRTFRFVVDNAAEVNAAYELAMKFKLRWLLVDPVEIEGLDKVDWTSDQAVGVIFNPEFRPGVITNPVVPVSGRKQPSTVWQRVKTLVDAGAGHKLAIRPAVDADMGSLLFLAGIFQRGGLSTEQVLRMLTVNPANMLGTADRVGSLRPGADADFVVLSGEPFSSGTRVSATYIEGSQVYGLEPESNASVIEAAQVVTPSGIVAGGVAVVDGKIVGVGQRVSLPRNAQLRRFENAVIVPGWIDCGTALGIGGTLADQLSLETGLGELLARDDEQMAFARQGGVTTAFLSSTRLPSPVLAFKLADQPRPLKDPVALRFEVSGNLTAAEENVRQLLAKGKSYVDAWNAYDAAFAEYEKKLKEYEAAKQKYDDAVKAAEAKKEAEKAAEQKANEAKATDEAAKREAGKDAPAETKPSENSTEAKPGSDNASAPSKPEASSKNETQEDVKKNGNDATELTEPKKPEEPKKPTAVAAMEPYRPLFAKKIAALVDVSDPRAVEVAVRLFRKEFDLHTAMVASSAAVANAELLAQQNVLVVVGPKLIEIEDGQTMNIPAELSLAGVSIGFQSASTTGANVLPEVVAFGVFDGLGRGDAVKGMSHGVAGFFKLDSVGAIEIGRDADLVVLSGPPFEISSQVLAVMIDGKWVYEKESE